MSLEGPGFKPSKKITPDAEVVANVLSEMVKEAKRRGLSAANDNEVIANNNEEVSEFGGDELKEIVRKFEQNREAA